MLPTGVWRVKRTVHVEVDGEWVDIAPGLLSRGVVFPFPFIGEDLHNEEYLDLALAASEKQVGVFDPTACGSSGSAADEEHLSLEVVPDGPGQDSADAEFVMIYNGSDHDIDLRGWMVQDTSPLNAYFFPKGAVVRADDYVVVFSELGHARSRPGRQRGRPLLLRRNGGALEQRHHRHRVPVRRRGQGPDGQPARLADRHPRVLSPEPAPCSTSSCSPRASRPTPAT